MYDIIVVGAGIEGLATAYYAVTNNQKTLLLEQNDWPHGFGSSQGKSRIIRRAHSADLYAQLMDDAFDGWMQLEKETGQKIYVNTGMVVFGSPSNSEMASFAKSLGDKCKKLTATEMKETYPGFTPPDNYYGLYDAEGGVLLADKALAAYMSRFIAQKGTFQSNTKVLGISHKDGVLNVATNTTDQLYAKSVVLATGPWTGHLLKRIANMDIPTEAHETCVPYWRLNGKYDYSGSRFPVLLYRGTEEDAEPYHFYFKPCIEDSRRLNAGVHFGIKFDPGTSPGSQKLTERYLKIARKAWRRFLPGIDFDSPPEMKGCVYTENMADDDYILDQVKNLPNVYFATGFAGTGFKMAPVIGKTLARMACGLPAAHDISAFKATRFQNSRL